MQGGDWGKGNGVAGDAGSQGGQLGRGGGVVGVKGSGGCQGRSGPPSITIRPLGRRDPALVAAPCHYSRSRVEVWIGDAANAFFQEDPFPAAPPPGDFVMLPSGRVEARRRVRACPQCVRRRCRPRMRARATATPSIPSPPCSSPSYPLPPFSSSSRFRANFVDSKQIWWTSADVCPASVDIEPKMALSRPNLAGVGRKSMPRWPAGRGPTSGRPVFRRPIGSSWGRSRSDSGHHARAPLGRRPPFGRPASRFIQGGFAADVGSVWGQLRVYLAQTNSPRPRNARGAPPLCWRGSAPGPPSCSAAPPCSGRRRACWSSSGLGRACMARGRLQEPSLCAQVGGPGRGGSWVRIGCRLAGGPVVSRGDLRSRLRPGEVASGEKRGERCGEVRWGDASSEASGGEVS